MRYGGHAIPQKVDGNVGPPTPEENVGSRSEKDDPSTE